MKKEKAKYLKPDFSVVLLYAESVVCDSYSGDIDPVDEAADNNDWSNIY